MFDMVELIFQECLQLLLFDCFIDDELGNFKEVVECWVLILNQLKVLVLCDLVWLFNIILLFDYGFVVWMLVGNLVFNYGLLVLVGYIVLSVDVYVIEVLFIEIIVIFELCIICFLLWVCV